MKRGASRAADRDAYHTGGGRSLFQPGEPVACLFCSPFTSLFCCFTHCSSIKKKLPKITLLLLLILFLKIPICDVCVHHLHHAVWLKVCSSSCDVKLKFRYTEHALCFVSMRFSTRQSEVRGQRSEVRSSCRTTQPIQLLLQIQCLTFTDTPNLFVLLYKLEC